MDNFIKEKIELYLKNNNFETRYSMAMHEQTLNDFLYTVKNELVYEGFSHDDIDEYFKGYES